MQNAPRDYQPRLFATTGLTNGQQHRLFESITGREITKTEEIRKGQVVYSVALPPNLQAVYEEAVTYFLGCSDENLLTFCRQHTAESLASLKGSATDRTKKYLPDLFVLRQPIQDEVAAFRASCRPLLAVVAEAGTGKTCCLCALADELVAAGEPVLFYRGFTLLGQILATVASDFSWTFAEEQSASHLVRRLDKILGDRLLILMIDAVDEWEHPQRIQDLLATARHLSGHRIKIIVTCKTSVWSEFLTWRRTPTGLSELSLSVRLPTMNLRCHFDFKRQEEKLRLGKMPVTRHEDGGISYSWEPCLDDFAWIQEQVKTHLYD